MCRTDRAGLKLEKQSWKERLLMVKQKYLYVCTMQSRPSPLCEIFQTTENTGKSLESSNYGIFAAKYILVSSTTVFPEFPRLDNLDNKLQFSILRSFISFAVVPEFITAWFFIFFVLLDETKQKKIQITVLT